MNSRGQLIITDLMLYIVLLIVILAMIVYALNYINTNQVATISNYEVNQMLESTLDTLVKTEGTPENWDESKNIKTIGLKKNSTTSSISYNKLIKLKNNNYLLDDFISEGIDYSLDLILEDNQEKSLHIAGEYSLSDKENIYSRQVPIILDYDYDIYTISSNNNTNYCPENHNNLRNTWSCKSISVNKSSLINGEFYIITNKNTKYEITNTYNEKITGNIENQTQINNQMDKLMKTDNDTLYIHINTQDTSYVVYDKNNQQNHLDSIYNPKVYLLKLSISN